MRWTQRRIDDQIVKYMTVALNAQPLIVKYERRAPRKNPVCWIARVPCEECGGTGHRCGSARHLQEVSIDF